MFIEIEESVIERGLLELNNYPNEFVQDMVLELKSAIKQSIQYEDPFEINELEDLQMFAEPPIFEFASDED